MSIIYNNTSINQIKYNGTVLRKIIYNNTIVYEISSSFLANTTWTRLDSSKHPTITPSFSATTSNVTLKVDSIAHNNVGYPGGSGTTAAYVSQYIDLTSYTSLSLSGTNSFQGSTDFYSGKVWLEDSSGNVTLIYSESRGGFYTIDQTVNLASYSGNYRLRLTIGTYQYWDSSTVNVGGYITLTKALLS